VDEVQPPDLIDGHINMTMEKTTKRIEAMKHDVMFIDECSQLFPKKEGETHFGYEYVASADQILVLF
jgi:zona occludens toxin (predicted ATPase)